MGKNTFFGKLGDLAGEALGKVDTESASKAVNSALDAAQKATGGLGRRADPIVRKAKEAAPRLLDKAKGALGEDRPPTSERPGAPKPAPEEPGPTDPGTK
jgi:hypothetical protein